MSSFIRFLRDYWPLAFVFAACILCFVVDAVTESRGSFLMDRYMMVPQAVSLSWQSLLAGDFEWESLKALTTLLSYAFLHADGEHIALNLVFIWVFGSLVYRELGAAWFFGTFVITAIAGGVGQVLLSPESSIPVLGASGALLGFEGIFFGMALRWRLPKPDVWPIAEPVPQERLMIFAAIGVLLDISGLVGGEAGVAYGAHIGGFVAGFVLGTTLIPRPRNAV
ncbi:MAG: rhomboid family intramembrane serine protease [Opitutaceae bacterium]